MRNLNNLWKNIIKHAGPVSTAAFGALSIDSWLNGRKEKLKDQLVKEALERGVKKEAALELAAKESEKNSDLFIQDVGYKSEKIDLYTQKAESCLAKINEYQTQINSGTLDSFDLGLINKNLAIYEAAFREASKMRDENIQALLDLVQKKGIIPTEILEQITSLFDTIREYISILTSEQLVILFNVSGYVLLLFILTSITSVLIGDILINYFKVESKYPNLYKYIQYRQKISKFYMRLNLVYLYFVITLLISINLFMLLYDYF
jgi:hypothetical protein